MSTTTREIGWLDIIHRADPDFDRASNWVVEYAFTSHGTPHHTGNAHLTHEGGQRVFRAHYRTRGAYGPDTEVRNGLIWGGQAMTWGGDEITWGNA